MADLFLHCFDYCLGQHNSFVMINTQCLFGYDVCSYNSDIRLVIQNYNFKHPSETTRTTSKKQTRYLVILHWLFVPSRAEPSRAEPSRAGPSRAEPGRAGPGRAEPSRAEPGRSIFRLRELDHVAARRRTAFEQLLEYTASGLVETAALVRAAVVAESAVRRPVVLRLPDAP